MVEIDNARLFLESHARKERQQIASRGITNGPATCGYTQRSVHGSTQDQRLAKVYGSSHASEIYKKLENTMNVDINMLNLDDSDDDDGVGCSLGDRSAEETPDPDVIFADEPGKPDLVF